MSQLGSNVIIQAVGAQTATFSSSDFEMAVGAQGLVLFQNISASPTGTTPTLVTKLQGKDPISGAYYDIPGASIASQNAAGETVLTVHPAITAVTNVAVSQLMPKTFKTVSTITGTTPSFAMSLAANFV